MKEFRQIGWLCEDLPTEDDLNEFIDSDCHDVFGPSVDALGEITEESRIYHSHRPKDQASRYLPVYVAWESTDVTAAAESQS